MPDDSQGLVWHVNRVVPPGDDPTFRLVLPNGRQRVWNVADLLALPPTILPAYTFVTDHGAHGPYRLQGAALRDVVAAVWDGVWQEAEVVSADGYSNRVQREEVEGGNSAEIAPILLCYAANDQPLTRRHGLIRLVVPSETDNALRQIKWVHAIRLR